MKIIKAPKNNYIICKCGCEFEFEKEDIKDIDLFNPPIRIKGVECPYCGSSIDIVTAIETPNRLTIANK